jgi:hypothetical protein
MKRLFNISPLWIPAILATVMFVGTAADAVQPIVDRNPQQMCEEVAYELNIQVEEGMLDKEAAQKIIDRCYRIFVDSK